MSRDFYEKVEFCNTDDVVNPPPAYKISTLSGQKEE
jgi:hypothetical protein